MSRRTQNNLTRYTQFFAGLTSNDAGQSAQVSHTRAHTVQGQARQGAQQLGLGARRKAPDALGTNAEVGAAALKPPEVTVKRAASD